MDIAKLVADEMMNEVLDNPENFDDSGDYESLFERHFEKLGLEEHNYARFLESKAVTEVMEEIQQYIREYQSDKEAYRRDPLGYYGMRQGDFL